VALSESERDKKFFYTTELNAGMYDATVDCVVPLYRDMHAMILRFLDLSFSQDEQTSGSPSGRVILEIGSGTGALSIPLLQKFPLSKLVAVDFSPAMNDVFRRSFALAFPSDKIESRVRFVEDDILGGYGQTESLRGVVEELTSGQTRLFDATVSALTLHHFERQEKFEVYSRMFNVLKSGGLLLNGDLFSYESGALKSAAQSFDQKWIRENFERRAKEVESIGEEMCADTKSPSEWRRLGSLWWKHYDEDHRLDSTELQEQMLRFINFRQTGVPFRYWEGGILWGCK
jgi:SAM-dependent methyltransferase